MCYNKVKIREGKPNKPRKEIHNMTPYGKYGVYRVNRATKESERLYGFNYRQNAYDVKNDLNRYAPDTKEYKYVVRYEK